MEYRLKQQYIEAIKRDAVLYGKVAHAMGIGAPSLAFPLRKNSLKFTQKHILELLSDYLDVEENDLLEKINEPQAA
jgi:hypothetical protein